MEVKLSKLRDSEGNKLIIVNVNNNECDEVKT